jgi:hypothetical protein
MRFELIVHRRCHASVMGRSQNGQPWRAKLRPGSSSSFAHRAPHPGRALHEVGSTVLSIVGVRSMDLLFWEARIQAVSDELIACTDDGSYGREALWSEFRTMSSRWSGSDWRPNFCRLQLRSKKPRSCALACPGRKSHSRYQPIGPLFDIGVVVATGDSSLIRGTRCRQAVWLAHG